MRQKRMGSWVLAIAFAAAGVCGAAAEGIKDFTLSKAIPSDVFMAIHTRSHDGQEFLNKQYARVWEAVEKARLDRDIKRLMKSIATENGTDAEEFEAHWQLMSDLFMSVEWSALAGREYAMGMRMSPPMVEFVSLMMPPGDKVDSSFEGLSGLAQKLVELTGGMVTLTTDGEGSSVVHKIMPASETPVPIVFTLAREKDVIVVGFGSGLVEQSLALLRGEGGETLASTDRFQAAFKKLPAPKDMATFVDLRTLFRNIRGFMDFAMQAAAADASESEQGEVAAVKNLLTKCIGAFEMFEYTAAVRSTDGMKSTEESLTVLSDDAESRAMYSVMFGNPPIKDGLRYIPANASDFSFNSGVRLVALYDWLIDLIKNDVPEGGEAISGIEEMESEFGLNIRDDILGWMKGGFISHSVPGPSSYSSPEWVMMLEVSDEAKATALLDRIFTQVEPLLAGQNGSIVEADIEGAEGFRSVIIPAMAMMGIGKPTIGVKDGWLMLGASPEILETTLAVAAGKEDNISKNERYRKEGIIPDNDAVSATFGDLTSMGEQLGQALAMVPMMAMAIPDAGKNPALQTMFSVIGKCGRIVRTFDFLLSQSSVGTMSGRELRTRMVVNYREPPTVEKPTRESSEGSAGGD